MKRIMKTVQSSYLHLFNILLSWVEFSSWVIESSFLTWSECLSSTSQFDLTLFQKKIQFNLILFKSSTQLELKYLTWCDQSSFYFNNFLSEQHSKSLRFLTLKNDEHWKINNILNSKCYWDQIQYKVKWMKLNQDNEWYYVDKEEFKSLKEVLVEFHKLYSDKSHWIEKQWKFLRFIYSIHVNMNFQREKWCYKCVKIE